MKITLQIATGLCMWLLAACNGQHTGKNPISAADTVSVDTVKAMPDTLQKTVPVEDNGKHTRRRLSYLFYANGGLVGYFNDGTVVGCPRCDPTAGSVALMLEMQPMGKYVVLKDGSLLVDGSRKEYPRKKKEWNEWIIFDSDAEWERFMNNKDDLTSERNQQHLMQFLKGYAKICEKQMSLKETMNWVLASPDVTGAYKAAYQKFYRENPEPDFDPVLNAQDCPEKIELRSIGLTDYYFTFSTSENDKHLLVAKVKRTNDKWLVDGCGSINIPDEKNNR